MTPLHVVIVQLAFERVASARELLARHATLTHYSTMLEQRTNLRVSVAARFWREDQFKAGGVSWHYCVDDAACLVAAPWTRPEALYRRIEALRPDIVHVNGLIFPRQIRALRRRLPATTAIVAQHHGEMQTHRYVRWTPRATLHGVDGFMFTAAGIADDWRASGRIAAHQRVFEVAEASSLFAPQPRDEARRATGMYGSPAVLWVGRLHARKSPLLALDAFDRARGRLGDPHLFMIYGEEPLLPEVHAFCAARPGLAERVHLIGRVDHTRLAAWFSAADLFLTTSPAEGSNYALIEGLACGLLPVCSDNPAHVALTGGGARGSEAGGAGAGASGCEAGVLFPCGDAARGADALIEAAARVARGGEASRRNLRGWFERHLSWSAIAAEAAAAYGDAAHRRRTAAV